MNIQTTNTRPTDGYLFGPRQAWFAFAMTIGLMLFELLIGRPAFMAKDETAAMIKIVREGVPIAELDDANVARPLQKIVAKATARNPNERYANAGEMCIALEDWMSSEGLFVSPSRLSLFLASHGLYT